ncbi:LPS assembly lipoprotein LptE [Sneathiella sp. HT1-7]|uniref:LPS assembly lipoprotein LptE n=1 Tax=Sneathiella sp. HT1-7 TaxID=2887192 RepID=UPI001D15B2BD|nr:LPS assembly lipoprotein LptE [Sneathiella sp. HT1-7]MCC3303984.1 LPS assembly lipoprotein LptE [Sneathiella sp. HT1-7]
MSLFRVSLVFLIMSLAAACGFQPLYGSATRNAGVQEKLAQIYVEPIGGRTGQILRNELLDLANPGGIPRTPAYRLAVVIEVLSEGLAIQNDDTKTRYNLTLNSKFRLTDATGKEAIYSGSTQNIASYNVVQSEFANLAAANNAEKRAALVAAEQINQQLSVFFAGR